MAYSLISFDDSGVIKDAVVPSNWVLNGYVYWCDSLNAKRNLENCSPLNMKWPKYRVLKIKLQDGMCNTTISQFQLKNLLVCVYRYIAFFQNFQTFIHHKLNSLFYFCTMTKIKVNFKIINLFILLWQLPKLL